MEKLEFFSGELHRSLAMAVFVSSGLKRNNSFRESRYSSEVFLNLFCQILFKWLK